MGKRHNRYVRYDDSGKQSGGGPASISLPHLGSDVLTRIWSEKRRKKTLTATLFKLKMETRYQADGDDYPTSY